MATTLKETPCFVVFDFLKQEANLTYKDFALHLFNKQAKYGKVLLADRLEDKTFLSRQVVRLMPKEMSPSMFADFATTATFAWNELKAASAAREASEDEKVRAAYERLIDVAVPKMTDALRAFGLKGNSFMNVVITVSNMANLKINTKGFLVTLLFIVAGCVGDVSLAIDIVLERMNMQGAEMRTAQIEDAETADLGTIKVDDANYGLALFRIKNGVMVTPGFELFEGEEGTEVGLLPKGLHVIADVENTVSRRHLKIWKTEDDKWIAQGLGSKNGTVKIDATTKCRVVIENPRVGAARQPNPPVEIKPGDHLILGQDTEFIVCRTMGR